MSLPRTHRRFPAWLAMLALLLGSLAPGLGQSLAQSSGRLDWVQVCSASGMFWVQVGADSRHDSTDRPAAHGSPSCPWCTLHGGAPGLPPAPLQVQALPVWFSQPLMLLAAVPRSTIWTPAQARAPPQAG